MMKGFHSLTVLLYEQVPFPEPNIFIDQVEGRDFKPVGIPLGPLNVASTMPHNASVAAGIVHYSFHPAL